MAVLRLPSSDPSSLDPISPELVLVSPELRERLADLLPDRPWEAFVPAPPVGLRVAELAAPRALAPPPRPRRRPPVLTVTFAVAATVALIVTGLMPARNAPTLGATAPRAPLRPPVVPGAVYSVNLGGTLRVATDGRSFELSGLDVACLSPGRRISVPVLPDASFGLVQSTWAGSSRTFVEVSGQFEAGAGARGLLRVRSGTCDSRPLELVASVQGAQNGGGRGGGAGRRRPPSPGPATVRRP
jgi:hypothetical protein